MKNREYYQRYSSKDALSSNARFDCQRIRMERGGVSWMLYCGVGITCQRGCQLVPWSQ
ncbi:hypothetical protein COLO4_05933 [Corchorus olitorius]|uniref:Uncharacterized protein n=1 Tax=Corchorus olitorius TaxID=93759 RepID=A0A1R3KPK0_9ROSI|nr:hypothetical protein COLO4_05933 [Corchorus olitorius]